MQWCTENIVKGRIHPQVLSHCYIWYHQSAVMEEEFKSLS